MDKTTITIEIGGQEFALRFGYAMLRRLGELWKMNSVDDVIQKIGDAGVGFETGNVPFDAVNTLVDIIVSSIKASNQILPDEIDNDVVADFIFSNIDKVTEIFLAIASAMSRPASQDLGKQKPAKTKRR